MDRERERSGRATASAMTHPGGVTTSTAISSFIMPLVMPHGGRDPTLHSREGPSARRGRSRVRHSTHVAV
jgi:hypothetical protein